MQLRVIIFWFIAEATCANALANGFDISQLPATKDITLPPSSLTWLPQDVKVQLNATGVPQTIRVVLDPVIGLANCRCHLEVIQNKAKRTWSLRPAQPLLLSFNSLQEPIVLQLQSQNQKKASKWLRIQIISDQALQITRL